MSADNQQGRTKKTNRYRLSFDNSYREREWRTWHYEFEAKTNRDAIVYAKKYIKKQNKRYTLEQFKLTGIERIVREAVKEKTVRINIS